MVCVRVLEYMCVYVHVCVCVCVCGRARVGVCVRDVHACACKSILYSRKFCELRA